MIAYRSLMSSVPAKGDPSLKTESITICHRVTSRTETTGTRVNGRMRSSGAEATSM